MDRRTPCELRGTSKEVRLLRDEDGGGPTGVSCGGGRGGTPDMRFSRDGENGRSEDVVTGDASYSSSCSSAVGSGRGTGGCGLPAGTGGIVGEAKPCCGLLYRNGSYSSSSGAAGGAAGGGGGGPLGMSTDDLPALLGGWLGGGGGTALGAVGGGGGAPRGL